MRLYVVTYIQNIEKKRIYIRTTQSVLHSMIIVDISFHQRIFVIILLLHTRIHIFLSYILISINQLFKAFQTYIFDIV